MHPTRSFILAATILAAPFGMARADTTIYYRAGAWHAFSGTGANNAVVCGVGTEAASDNRQLNLSFVIGGTDLRFRAEKPSWHIPDGIQAPVTMQVNGEQPWSVQATGHGNALEWTLAGDAIRQFDDQFRRGTTLTLNFPSGNEASWSLPLAGSTAVSNTFGRCITDMNARMKAPQTEPAGPTQPFSVQQPTPSAAPPPVGGASSNSGG